jgi:hypothetical protein
VNPPVRCHRQRSERDYSHRTRREQDEPNVPVEQTADEMGIGGTRVVELDSLEAVINILRGQTLRLRSACSTN